MRDDIFLTWLKFGSWVLPIIAFIDLGIYHLVGGQDPYRGGAIMFFYIIIYILYFLSSLGIIFRKYFKLKK